MKTVKKINTDNTANIFALHKAIYSHKNEVTEVTDTVKMDHKLWVYTVAVPTISKEIGGMGGGLLRHYVDGVEMFF